MRARFGEATHRVLGCLSGGEGSCLAVASTLQAKPTSIGTILLRLTKNRYLERRRVQEGLIVIDKDENVTRPRYVYLYVLTDKGRRRLERFPAKGSRRKR